MQKRSGVNSLQSVVQCNIIRMRDKTKIRIMHQNGETVLEFVMIGILLIGNFMSVLK